MKKNTLIKALSLLLSVVMAFSVLTLLSACGNDNHPDDGKKDPTVDPVDPGQKDPEQPEEPDGPKAPDVLGQPLDLYVAVNAADNGDGSREKPFATVIAARDYVRKLDKSWYSSITVHVGAGEYMNTSIGFSAEDSGTETCPITYVGEGDRESVINAGISLPMSAFKPVTDSAVLARLTDDAQQHVLAVNLADFNVTAAMYGGIYSRGVYCPARFYDDGQYTGSSSVELFYNGTRMTLARYPNEGWLGTGAVVEAGEDHYSDSYHDGGNPKGGTYRVDDELAQKIAGWATFKDVWLYGYFFYDWADSSTIIGAFDAENKTLTHKFASWYGYRADAPYYFYNVFEEMDAPGEWYLDRDNGILYVYPPENADLANDTMDMSLMVGPVLSNSASFVTFDNLTLKNSRGDGINAYNCNHVTVKNCHVTDVSAAGMNWSKVSDCVIYNNLVNHVGTGGIWVDGGDPDTLTRGNNLVDNNTLHDWSEVIMSSQDGISLKGCGNTASHNLLYNSPHTGMGFTGPYQILEYNELHHICENATDSGVIYAGRNWVSYGSEVRYNYIHDIGNETYQAMGIYMDDCMSGVRIFGNVLVDVSGIDDWVHGQAFQLGGGRDLIVENNFIVSTMAYDAGSKWYAFVYDQRGHDGFIETDDYAWFTHTKPGGGLFEQLHDSAWGSDLWKNAFPNQALIQEDFDNVENNPYWGGNPAFASIKNNVIVAACEPKIEIMPLIYQYGEVEDFLRINDVSKLFRKWQEGDWTMYNNASIFKDNPSLEVIDMKQIGLQPTK